MSPPGRQAVNRRRFLATSLATLAAAPLGMLACSSLRPGRTAAAEPSTSKDDNAMQQTAHPASPLPVEGRMPSFDGATGWLNSQPLTPDGLRGKVVLVEFLTYTCINWLRTMPYVRAWSEKYRDHGLVVIGVHTPEFPFEKDVENVRRAIDDMRIEFPIAIDSDYGVWQAFANHYWPALYFVDAMGRIRHHRFGEGEYGRSEMVIQQLLAEAGQSGVDQAIVPVEGVGIEVQADWENLRTPETYVGYQQAERFASPGGARAGHAARLRRARAASASISGRLAGDWTVNRGSAVAERARRADRLPLPRPRRASRHGAGHARRLGAVSRAARRPGTGRRARRRRGRAGLRDRFRAAAVPAHPPAGAHRRPTVRDRVS